MLVLLQLQMLLTIVTIDDYKMAADYCYETNINLLSDSAALSQKSALHITLPEPFLSLWILPKPSLQPIS